MEAGFWHQRWRDNLIGFHQAEVNLQLQAFWPRLEVPSGAQVFVPLCGKSRDMLWLAARHPVLGVELSPIAVQAFFAEAGLVPERREEGAFTVYETQGLRLWCGDFFDLRREQLATVRAVYDRASLIALPPELRQHFVSHLHALLPAGVVMLLVTMEYEQAEMQGPPFCVEEAEVHTLFEPAWSVQRVHVVDVLADEPKFRERGLSRLSEKVFHLTCVGE